MALPKFFNYLHNPLSPMTASAFFDVVEIAEMVLCYLPLPDILNMQSVSKRLFAIIEDSSHIQEKFTLQSQFEILPADDDNNFVPRHDVIFNMRLKDDPRLTLRRLAVPDISAKYSDCETYHGPPDYGIRIWCHPDLWTEKFRPGQRLRKIVVVSPGLTAMGMTMTCCNATKHKPQPDYIANEDGITLGDLYDAVVERYAEWRRCPYFEPHHADRNRNPSWSVFFRAALPRDVLHEFHKYAARYRDEEREALEGGESEG